MKKIGFLFLACGLIAFIIGTLSRITKSPVSFIPGTIEARQIFEFVNTCVLIAIAFLIAERLKQK